jgi:hypothetical protein
MIPVTELGSVDAFGIEKPLAIATLTWVSAPAGGRRSGPPTAPVYAATAVFGEGDEAEVHPGWPVTADQVSILLQRLSPSPEVVEDFKIGLLFPEMVISNVRPGAEFVVLEGPKVVAHGVIREVLLQ